MPIVPPTLVIKGVSKFMSHDYSDSTKIKSSGKKKSYILKMYMEHGTFTIPNNNFLTFDFMVG